MNPVAQRNHTTRMDETEQAIARFAESALTKIAELEREIRGVSVRLDDEQLARLTRAAALRALMDAEDHRTRVSLAAFTAMGRWARLRWLVIGRWGP